MAAKTLEIAQFLKNTYPFKQFPNEMLDRFIEAMTVVDLAKGKELFQVGDTADRLYIVLNGHITLERINQSNQYETFAEIDPGEFFGLEAIRPRNQYRVKATASANAKVFYIRTPDLINVMKENPESQRIWVTLHKSYLALVEMRLSWKEPDENVFLSIRKHSVFLWGKLLIPVFIFLAVLIFLAVASLSFAENFGTVMFTLLIALVVTGIPALYIYIDWKDDFYIVTDRKVLSRQRDILLYETKNIVPYSAVLSVTKKVPGFWAAFLLFGDVDLRTYTGVMKLHGIADPEIISALISDIRGRQTSIKKQYTREENIQEMRKRLGLEQEVPNTPMASPAEDANKMDLAEDNSFRFINSFFQTVLQLRVVKGDEVTYRKHWFILLQTSSLLYLLGTAILFYLVYAIISLFSYSLPIPPSFLTIPIMVAGVVVFGILIYRFIDWRNDRFVLTNQAIMDLDKKPLGNENRRTASLANIQAVEYKREGLIRILLNFGTVFIRVGDTQFSFDEVANPFAVQQEITERLNQAKDRERHNEIKRERETILDWIEIYHTVAHTEKDSKDDPPEETQDDVIQF